MKIEIIESSISCPMIVKENFVSAEEIPEKVKETISENKLWTLIAWKDLDSGIIGMSYKGLINTYKIEQIKSISLSYMRKAKGLGFVELTAFLTDNIQTRLLETEQYSEDAVRWFRKVKKDFEDTWSLKIQINDYGSDC